MLGKLFATFLAGLLAILPLVITVGLVGFVYSKLQQWLGPRSRVGQLLHNLSVRMALHPVITYCITFIAVVMLITMIGFFARRATEVRMGRLIARIPVISTIYDSTQKMVDVLAGQPHASSVPGSLKQVVLARISNGSILGLLANREPVVVDGVSYYMVFWPGAPIPASGQNYLVPIEDVRMLDMTVEELTQVYVSMGSLAPALVSGSEKAPPQVKVNPLAP